MIKISKIDRAYRKLAKLKQNHNRCPLCGSDTFIYVEKGNYLYKMGKCGDYDAIHVEDELSYKFENSKNAPRYSLEQDDAPIGSEEFALIRARSKIKKQVFVRQFNKRTSSKLPKIFRRLITASLNCKSCHWYKYVLNKDY